MAIFRKSFPTLREIARQAHGDPADLDLFVAHDSPVSELVPA